MKKMKLTVIVLLFLIGIVNYFDRTALSIANTSMQADLGISPSQMGVLLSAFSLAYALSQLPLGIMIDRLGGKIALGGSLIFWSASQFLFGVVNSFSSLIGLRVLLGIGEAPMFPSAAKVLAEWFDEKERGTATGIVWSATCIGPCISPTILTLFVIYLGWRGMFITTGVLGLIVGLCWFVFYKNKDRFQAILDHTEQQLDAAPKITFKQQLTDWAVLFKNKNTWGTILGFMGVIYMLWLYLTWLPGYFEKVYGLNLLKTAWVLSLVYLFGAIGILFAGRLCDTLVKRGMGVLASRKLVIIAGLLTAAVATLVIAYINNFVLCVVFVCIVLFAINLCSATAWMIVNTIVSSKKVASVGSIQNFGAYLAASAAPIITGYSIEYTGSFKTAFLTSVVIAVISVFAYFFLVTSKIDNEQAEVQTA